MICKFEYFWPIFEMMTSQHRARISKFWKNRFLNKYLTSKFFLLLIFRLSITISLSDTSLGPLSSQFWIDDVTTMSQNFKILIKSFSKRIIYLKETFTLDFHHSVDNSTWNTGLDLFDLFLGLRRHRGESKLQNFEIVISKTNTSPHIFLYCWLSSCIQVWAFLTQL